MTVTICKTYLVNLLYLLLVHARRQNAIPAHHVRIASLLRHALRRLHGSHAFPMPSVQAQNDSFRAR